MTSYDWTAVNLLLPSVTAAGGWSIGRRPAGGRAGCPRIRRHDGGAAWHRRATRFVNAGGIGRVGLGSRSPRRSSRGKRESEGEKTEDTNTIHNSMTRAIRFVCLQKTRLATALFPAERLFGCLVVCVSRPMLEPVVQQAQLPRLSRQALLDLCRLTRPFCCFCVRRNPATRVQPVLCTSHVTKRPLIAYTSPRNKPPPGTSGLYPGVRHSRESRARRRRAYPRAPVLPLARGILAASRRGHGTPLPAVRAPRDKPWACLVGGGPSRAPPRSREPQRTRRSRRRREEREWREGAERVQGRWAAPRVEKAKPWKARRGVRYQGRHRVGASRAAQAL